MRFTSIKRFLLKERKKEYITLDFKNEELSDFHSYVAFNNKTIELTGKEAIVCLNPPTICILIKDRFPDTVEIFYTCKKNRIATVTCKKKKLKEASDSFPQLFRIVKTSLTKHSWLKLFLYYVRSVKNKAEHSFNIYRHIAGLFFYPRKVILVSVTCNEFISIFPMDLQIQSPSGDSVFLGLRHSNKTNEFIQNNNLKISIADFHLKNKEDAYAFGKFHSTGFPDPNDLPYHFLRTNLNKNLFPDFIENYKELELTGHLNLGSQNLLIFKVINESDFNRATGHHLYHLHYLALNE